MSNLKAQEQFADYFDANALRVPDPVYRLENGGKRYYYDFDEQGQPQFEPSATTLISEVLPTSPHLVKWVAQMGYDQAELYKKERARYGTIMHILIKHFLLGNSFDLDEGLHEHLEKCGYWNDGGANLATPQEVTQWDNELKKDLLAFAQFRLDYDVRPLAIEMPLISHKLGVAGCIDMPCIMKLPFKARCGQRIKMGKNKGQRKLITVKRDTRAIVDFKSGRNGFYESSELQLLIYRALWNHKNPSLKVKRVFNWSPKDWRTAPTYKLKDQTETKLTKQLPHLLKLAKMRIATNAQSVSFLSGVLDQDSDPATLFNNCKLAEFVQTEVLLNKKQ